MKFLTLFLTLILLAGPQSAGAAPSARATHLLHLLKALPEGASPYHRVAMLASRLTKLDPGNALKYYKIASRLLSNEGGEKLVSIRRLQFVLAKIIKKSDLTPEQIAKIIKGIAISEVCYCPPPPPAPTPEPTP